MIFSLLFHLGTREENRPLAQAPEPEETTPLLPPDRKSRVQPLLLWKHWLLEPAFYQVSGSRALGVHRAGGWEALPFGASPFLPKSRGEECGSETLGRLQRSLMELLAPRQHEWTSVSHSVISKPWPTESPDYPDYLGLGEALCVVAPLPPHVSLYHPAASTQKLECRACWGYGLQKWLSSVNV